MVDLDELARRAVAAPPVAPSSLETLERRARQRRRRRRLAGAVPLLVLAVAVLIGVPRLVGDDDAAPVVAGEPDSDQVPSTWSEQQADGVSVAVPPGWVFTDEDLTPVVSDPRMIWAVGTDPIPGYGDEPCAQQPTAALDRLEPNGVLVVLLERRDGTSGFSEREDPLWAMRGDPNQSTHHECSSGDFDSWWFSFADEGRGFYLLVAVGPEGGLRIPDIARLVNSVTVTDRNTEHEEQGPAADAASAEQTALEFFDALARSDWERAARLLESSGSSPVEYGADLSLSHYAGTEIGRLIELESELADARDMPALVQAWCERHGGVCTPPVDATALTHQDPFRRDYVVEVELAATDGGPSLLVNVVVGWFEGELYLSDLPPPSR